MPASGFVSRPCMPVIGGGASLPDRSRSALSTVAHVRSRVDRFLRSGTSRTATCALTDSSGGESLGEGLASSYDRLTQRADRGRLCRGANHIQSRTRSYSHPRRPGVRVSLDHLSMPHESGPAGLFDRSIPPTRRTETRVLRDFLVSSQVGPLISMPVVGMVLIFRPEAAEAVLTAAVLTTVVLRNSLVRYRRQRWS